jgi:hypothetical protein
VLCLHNISETPVTMDIYVTDGVSTAVWTELLSHRHYPVGANRIVRVTLQPYEVNWLTAPGARPGRIATA